MPKFLWRILWKAVAPTDDYAPQLAKDRILVSTRAPSLKRHDQRDAKRAEELALVVLDEGQDEREAAPYRHACKGRRNKPLCATRIHSRARGKGNKKGHCIGGRRVSATGCGGWTADWVVHASRMVAIHTAVITAPRAAPQMPALTATIAFASIVCWYCSTRAT